MSKRFQVFVSSTYEDLKEERNRVIQALLNINCIPCGMEYFPAADEDAWHCIERLLPECDYYVIILAGKYGSIPEGEQKSFTHMEYELAVKFGVPVLGLLHKNPDQLPAERCERQAVRRRKLEAFRRQVGKRLCRFWTSPDQLPGELLPSLTLQKERYPRTGWVRADTIADSEAKNEIIALRKKVEQLSKTVADYQERERSEEQELASGSDGFAIRGCEKIWNEDDDIVVDWEIDTTWDELLQFIRNDVGVQWRPPELKEALRKTLERHISNDPLIEGRSHWKIEEAQLDRITVQLYALGLIVRKGTGWELSAKGLTHASRLIALRKGERERSLEDWCRVEWQISKEPRIGLHNWLS